MVPCSLLNDGLHGPCSSFESKLNNISNFIINIELQTNMFFEFSLVRISCVTHQSSMYEGARETKKNQNVKVKIVKTC